MKKIYIIAGEDSGDMLGAELMQALGQNEYYGIGGEKMTAADMNSLFPMQELSLMGFAEVVPHIFDILKRIKQTAEHIKEVQPDILITIDSPDFCFRVAKKLGKTKFPKVHYVAPSVWAYREDRAKKIAKIYDHILCLLPFEPPYFEKYGLKASFIGHSLLEREKEYINSNYPQWRKYKGIDERVKLLCVMPGSRSGELNRHNPIFYDVINRVRKEINGLHIVIPISERLRSEAEQTFSSLPIKVHFVSGDERSHAIHACDAALAKSGTGSLELAVAGVPQVVAYKANPLTAILAKKMLKIKYVNLINIMAEQELIPEFIQDNCKSELITEKLFKLLTDEEVAKKQIASFVDIVRSMQNHQGISPAQYAKKIIHELI